MSTYCTLKPNSQETAQNFENRVLQELQKRLKFTLYTYIPVRTVSLSKKNFIIIAHGSYPKLSWKHECEVKKSFLDP